MVCFPPDQAVRYLNSARLGKQRAEGLNILYTLEAAAAIARLLNYPLRPEGFTLDDDILREKWLKETYTRYKREGKKIYYTQNQSNERSYAIEKGTEVKSGWYSHPMTRMWVGYETALRHYINLCITEWIERGYNNNMPLFPIDGDVTYPWWVDCESLHKSHCGALLRKEAVREEPDWYWKNPAISFVAETEWYWRRGYLWISNLSKQQRQNLQMQDIPEYCADITNDYV